MTFWKGMFRLWILTSVFWAMIVTVIGWGALVSPSLPRKSFSLREGQSAPYELANPYPSYDWIREQRELYLPNSVTLYVARNITDDALATAREALIRRASDPRAGEAWMARLEAFLWMLLAIVGVSGSVLAFGFALRWVAQGFGFGQSNQSQRT